MGRFLLISPVKLYRHSFLAGSILLLACVLLGVDLATIGMRAYAFNTIQRWTSQDGLAGLDGILFSLLCAILYLVMQVFLLLDLVMTLLLPSRDLQEGAVIAYGIVSILQVPIVTLYLKWELSWINSVWLQRACSAVSHSSDCAAWWSRVRLVSIASSSAACALHLLLVGLCARYVHSRPATSQNLIMNHRMKRRSSRRSEKALADPEAALPRTRKPEGELSRLKDKLLRRKQRDAKKRGRAAQSGSYDGTSADEATGFASDRAPVAMPMPYDPPSGGALVHTDSESDLEAKQPLARL